ncbi:unnamed protein product [Sphagnum troendelagicum]|uniref:Uncharacterized protein n=1 Tax=Sphagnum troendelagicum TaxID=128251 RepID=A0ABP0UEX9_9BRYO
MSRCHLDKFMRHNRRRIKLARIIVAVALSLDTVASSNNEKSKLGNLQHHILLVIFIKAHVTFLAKRPLIFNVLDDVLVLNTPVAMNIKLVFNVCFVVIDFDDAFNFEHTDQQVLEELNLDLLLDDDHRSILQLDNNFVDLADHQHNGERDCPPLSRW